MNDPDLVQALLDAVDRGDDEAAEAAANACAGKTAILPALRPLLADPNGDRRWWAVRTLALLGGDAAIELLIERLNDPDEAVRCVAALGLGMLGAAGAAPHLAARLADGSGWVRDSAADALALLGEPALPVLTQALSDPRDGVRVRAASGLRRALVSLHRGGVNLNALSPTDGAAITALYRALNDPNRLVRHNAYEALNQLGLLEVVIPAG